MSTLGKYFEAGSLAGLIINGREASPGVDPRRTALEDQLRHCFVELHVMGQDEALPPDDEWEDLVRSQSGALEAEYYAFAERFQTVRLALIFIPLAESAINRKEGIKIIEPTVRYLRLKGARLRLPDPVNIFLANVAVAMREVEHRDPSWQTLADESEVIVEVIQASLMTNNNLVWVRLPYRDIDGRLRGMEGGRKAA